MSINLDKFKYNLVEGWREVMDSKNPIDWAIFGYDGQTFDLKLVCKGTGGIDEMVDNFNSGRIMYGLCRVKIKDRNVEKVALINWQGEGAPLARKGTCANHLTTVKHFFKGVHVTINARTDEDVDPENIRGNVAKTTSVEGVMSSSMEFDTAEPVGALYKKLNPQEEINVQAKDEFWARDQAEEENRKRSEKHRVAKFSQHEVKLLRKESQDYFEQEQLEKSSGTGWSPLTSQSPTTTNGDFNRTTTPSSTTTTASIGDPSPPTSPTFISAERDAVLQASAPRKHTENLVRQRIKSFDVSPSERLFMLGTVTTNGGNGSGSSVRSSSKSPASDADGEQLSVMKRKAMFESGNVVNTSHQIVKKDPAQEIKSLQEESQNQAKVAAAAQKQKALERSQTVPPPNPKKPAAPPAHAQPKSAAQAAAAMKPPHAHPPSTVKTYNLPFHIGGGVSSRLAEKVNRNNSEADTSTSGTVSKDKEPESVNHNGNGTSALSSLDSMPATLTTSAVTMAEFQADPIPQHITTNFEHTDNVPETVAKPSEPEVKDVEPVSAETPAKAKPITAPVPIEKEDTTVQSGERETKKSPSPLPTPTVAKDKEGNTTPTPIGPSFVIKPEMGLCARAVYDYQAADESEITFDPGEMITNIETIDEGWWEGMGPHGVYGLFPSNYVELIN